MMINTVGRYQDMQIQFTPKVAYRMIDRAKRNFLAYPHDSVNKVWKSILKNLQVFIVINPFLKTTHGTASFVPVALARKLFQIPDEYVPVKVDGRMGYLIIEVNPKLVILSSSKEVFDTLSHELAHCLDFVLRGFYNKTDEQIHDKFWSFLHKRMGGNGSKNCTKSVNKFQLKISSKRAKNITKNFMTA
jgi:hypothetical protein